MKYTLTKTNKLLLILLLVVLTILLRLQNTHQTDFDSYWLHGMAESIQLHGSALWVFHPTSLFGYYPLSYPSGTSFFLATFSTLTGLSMNTTVLVSSIFVGLLIVLGTFVVANKLFKNWFMSFFAAVIVSLSPTLISYTAFNTGGRVFIMPFYLLCIYALISWYESKKWKYVFLAIVAIICSFFIHRTAQFIAIFILAFIAAWLYMKIPQMWEYVKTHKHFKNHIIPRYEKSRYYLLFDVMILGLLLIIIKTTDLILRDRMGYQLNKLILSPIESAYYFYMIHIIPITAIILLGLVLCIGVFFYLKKKKNIHLFHWSKQKFHIHYTAIFENPQKYFVIIIGLLLAFVFIRQFFGESFYAPSFREFDTSFLSGTSPPILFANVMINYTTAVTPLFVLFLVGIIFLLVKKNKQLSDWFLLFTSIGFIGLLLDKRYIRIFIIPLIAIISSYGFFSFYSLLNKLSKNIKLFRSLKYVFMAVFLLLCVVGSYIPMIRSSTAETDFFAFEQTKMYWETGQYIRSINDKNFSTITTDELVAGVIIFASSGVPGGSHNIYYFVDEQYLRPVPLSFSDVRYKLKTGDKIENLWILPDWIFGGQYYVGRHTLYLFDRSFTDMYNKRIMDDYNERYYIHDKTLDKNKFLQSLEPVKNKLYDTPKTEIYAMYEGRE